ncbi:MAG: calcium-translocating P-type ATPase, PMCA-type [Prevotellaceae bacterium]|nr:calcium-translocating P-type ATPase, PMCA-type [Prevotellaceae bacterium]
MSNETNPLLVNQIGLTDNEVTKSREQHGENTLTPPKRTPLWKLYLEKYKDPIIKILLFAALISLGLAIIENEYIETIGIILAIFLATTIGFYFEMDAAKKFNVLTALGEESLVKVRRAGKVVQIARKDVVVGDVVIIEVGDEIPADGTLIESTDLQIDESSLTGEPIITKHADPEKNDKEATYPSSKVLRSTMVMNGRGEYKVTEVGDATEIGKVARSSTEITSVKTPLNIQLDKLAKLISKFGIGVSIAAFAIFLGHDIIADKQGIWASTDYLKMAEIVLQYFMMAVTLIVMAVPEGMPMAVTLSLALNMRRMLKNNNLVRKLHACETMGAVTVICTDKTGTLTQNKMQVADMVVYDKSSDVFNSAIALNTTAHLDEEGGKGIGNPTEVALLLWLDKNGVDYKTLRISENIEHQLPFSTERKYMATIANVAGERLLMVKGAPEIISTFCDIKESELEEIREKLRGYQNQAMRTLAFAYRKLAEGESVDTAKLSPESHLTFQAVAAISDPIRSDVPDAVKQCIDAGIKVKIVTGDTSATAIEIARQIGIWDEKTPATAQITGPDFAALSDEEAFERVVELRVMSRARPTDKQRLVNLLQKHDAVVAVTGDGTNDAPALNHAHVGLSLGSGTSVAKEASDMTLIDDSFRSIVNAVMWGRSLYKNIQRFLYFQLIVNVTALLLVLGGSLIGTDMPLTVTQILWVNLIMDTFAALALASLPPSAEVMKEKPRNRADFIITKGMAQGIIVIGLLFFVALFAMLIHCFNQGGGMQIHELSMFFTAFVMLQFWNLFNAKAFGSNHSAFHGFLRDKGLLLVLVMILAGQWFIVTFGGRMFRTVPLSLTEWIYIIAITSLVLWVGEIWRFIKRIRCKG